MRAGAVRLSQAAAKPSRLLALFSIDYSLTLHGPEGERLVGFDSAHPVARQTRGAPQDHRHRLRSIRAYAYQDAATLLADFWETVDAILRERQ